MSVSTIFLQSTNEGTNEYGDTTFSIHVPALDKSYKLQLATFMFRPKIILMDDTEQMIIRPTVHAYPQDRSFTEPVDTSYEDNDWCFVITTADITFNVYKPYQFQPSKTDQAEMKSLFVADESEISNQWFINLTCILRLDTITRTFTLKFPLKDMTWELTTDYKLVWKFAAMEFKVDDIINQEIISSWNVFVSEVEELHLDQLIFRIDALELISITPNLAYFSGLNTGLNAVKSSKTKPEMTITGLRAYNPHYWNYITLSCNKSYNTGNVVNQERYNNDIDDSSQFYKAQILGYMSNNAYAPEAMQTGMATANEYLINPGDFNSIRFWLNYDNGEPVKLCSPMTIVLNMMPNQAQ